MTEQPGIRTHRIGPPKNGRSGGIPAACRSRLLPHSTMRGVTRSNVHILHDKEFPHILPAEYGVTVGGVHALAGDTQIIRLWRRIQRLRRPSLMPRAGLPLSR